MGTDITPDQSTGIASWTELGAYVSAQGDRAREWIESAIPAEGLLINGYYVTDKVGNTEVKYIERRKGGLALCDDAIGDIGQDSLSPSDWINLASEVEQALRGEVGV